jgi:hypothetical protein
MNSIVEMINGKKTYITIVVVMIVVGLMACGINIPEFVWPLLAAAGLGSVRSAVGTVAPVQGSGFFTGKKTYILALIMAALAGLQAYGIPIPEIVYIMLGSLGAGTIRMAIPKVV